MNQSIRALQLHPRPINTMFFTLSDYPFAAWYIRDQLSRYEAADERTYRDTGYGGYGWQLQRVLEHRYP